MFKNICFSTFFTFLIAFSWAQDNLFTSYDLFKIKQVAEIAISPDGKHIAYTVKIPRPFSEEPGRNYHKLHLLNISSGESKLYITGKEFLHSINWTPDSRKITFLGKLDDATTTQVYAINIDGGSAMPVTNSKTSIESYEWHPGNESIAYISEKTDKSRNALIEKGFNAEIYEEDIPHKNLYIYDIKSKATEQITEGITVFDIAWSPKGDKIAAQVSEKNLIDYYYMFQKIHLINPKTKEIKQLIDNPGKLGEMEWSPDGKHLAFVSAIDIYDPRDGSLYIVPVPYRKKFADLKNYSKDFEGTVISIEWKDKNTVLFSAEESVDITLSEQTIGGANRNILLNGGSVVFHRFDYAMGTVAFGGNTAKHPNELFTYSIKKKQLKKHTDLNKWLDDKKLSKQEKISYKSRDGITIEGVLIYPLNYKEGEKYPLINVIHGGPESCIKNGWVTNYSRWGQVAAAKNYFVFMPNYRSSSGRGVKFLKMGQKDPADEEFNDVLDGIDYLVNKGMVDKDKVGIGGGSYGGYFSAWAATKHSNRFAAAVTFVGISNQLSKRYTTDIPYESYYVHWLFWPHENFELVIDRSPIKYATNNKTPTLILHGKDDPRVHPSQSLELYRALKLFGKAPVRLVWYPGEKHGNRKNPARLDYSLRTLEWFDYYLKSDNPKDKMPEKYLDYEVEPGT